MKVCRIATCDRAGEMQPLSDFPVNRVSKDGHDSRCLECCRRRSAEMRANKKGIPYVPKPRKQKQFSSKRPLRHASQEAIAQVAEAMIAGNRTRKQIKKAAGLSMDETCEALAVMVDRGTIYLRREDEEAYFYVKAVA